MKRFVIVLVLSLFAACTQTPAPTDLSPAHHPRGSFSTPGGDVAAGLARHRTGVYVVGYTTGDLDGPQAGERDAFVRKYDSRGVLLWGRQFGTETLDAAFGAASDRHDNVYVVGGTYGSLGGPYSGNDDTFVRKYSPAGNVLWTRQFGAGYLDGGFESEISVSGDNVYVAGTANPYTSNADAFLKNFSSSGVERWTEVFGTLSSDTARDVAVDGRGNAYVVGTTRGDFAEPVGGFNDMFVRKYTPSQDVAWTMQLDHAYVDVASAVTVNGPDVYIGGYYAFQDAASNTTDALVVKLSATGSLLWTKPFDLDRYDEVRDISARGRGVVFVGRTTPDFYSGQDDGFVYKLDRDGDPLWSRTLGTPAADDTNAVLSTPRGVFAAGSTNGELGASSRGEVDAYLTRLRGRSGATVWTEQ